MAISHANFLTQVRNYTEVDSNVLSDTLLDQFIRNVELDIAGKVDYDDLRKYATTSTITAQRFLSMPSDLIYLRSVQIINSNVKNLSTSDAFFWRTDNQFKTIFKYTDIFKLFFNDFFVKIILIKIIFYHHFVFGNYKYNFFNSSINTFI